MILSWRIVWVDGGVCWGWLPSPFPSPDKHTPHYHHQHSPLPIIAPFKISSMKDSFSIFYFFYWHFGTFGILEFSLWKELLVVDVGEGVFIPSLLPPPINSLQHPTNYNHQMNSTGMRFQDGGLVVGDYGRLIGR